jgi:endonuclease YncB( thermonuclease family)
LPPNIPKPLDSGTWIALTAVIGLYLFAGFNQPAASEETIAGQATVIDADTIEIHGQTIRIWGIDAPEERQLCQREDKPWRCGQVCANALDDHLVRRTVICKPRTRDRYKRIVAICSVGGEDIADWLVRKGCALDFIRYSKGAYAVQQGKAAAARRGMWQGPVEAPWDWRYRHRKTNRGG